MARFDFDAFAQGVNGPEDEVAAAAPLRADLSAAPLADQLGSASGEAIGKAREIMSIPLDPDSPQYGVVLRAQTSAVATVLGTQVKVEENLLRARDNPDRLAKLIARMEEETAKLPQLITGGAKLDGT
jgi:hypothetical protein